MTSHTTSPSHSNLGPQQLIQPGGKDHTSLQHTAVTTKAKPYTLVHKRDTGHKDDEEEKVIPPTHHS